MDTQVYNDAKAAHDNALQIIECPYLGSELAQQEDKIALSAYWSYMYAKNVLKGRFPKGEPVIVAYAESAYLYARDVIKGGYPEGEAIIAKSPGYSYYYAHYVLKGPFPKGERAIATKQNWSSLYKSKIKQAKPVKPPIELHRFSGLDLT